jgi:5'-3' exonuclease
MNYLKYRIPYEQIYNKLKTLGNIRRINFYIDLLSISRGFYNKGVIDLEINNYIENRTAPTLFIGEIREFLNGIYKNFNGYERRFIIFFDDGIAIQNKSLSNNYKVKNATADYFHDDEQRDIFKQIKKYYFAKIDETLNKEKLCSIIYLKQYETDCVAHYCIDLNISRSREDSTLNIILSADKDLLQTTEFKNTFQATSIYAKKEVQMNLWDKDECIRYIYPAFKRGFLTAKHIPLLLALSGDKADGIENIPQVGPAQACKLIVKYDLPPIFNESYPLPDQLIPYRKLIVNNLKLASFDLQIQRINDTDKIFLNNKLNILD